MRGKLGDQLRRDGFAVEPLLQHVERLHAMIAHDQQFAVDGAGQMQRVEQIGKAFGNILAGARIKPRRHAVVAVLRLCGRDRLHADAVPFPFRHEVGGVERGEIGLVERMRQHRRPERRRIGARGLFACALEPGEQFAIGRREAGPQQLDVVRVLAAERADGGFGQPRRHADAQAAGDELEQRPAPGLVERIEPARQLLRQLRLAERGQRFDDGGEGLHSPPLAGAPDRGSSGGCRPHQRDGFGKIADIIVGQFEQHRIGALGDQAADQPGLGVRKAQSAGERGERPAALGIGCRAEIIGDQPQLGVARRLIGEAVRAIRRSGS